MKIGFFDSGIGGLSVLHLAMRMLPTQEFVYYADEKHVPYGTKTKEEVLKYTDEAVSFMISKGVEAIVIACNTATSVAINDIRKKYNIPIIGMEPAVKKAIESNADKKVLVVATPITVSGQKMKGLIERVDKDHRSDLLPLPRLVTFAEEEKFDSKEVEKYLKDSFAELNLQDYSSLVLGCTHFIYFKDCFRKVLPDSVELIDGNLGTVNRLKSELGIVPKTSNTKANVEYYFSGKRTTKEQNNRIVKYDEQLDRLS
ncbi:MAG: glutamate racemase [Suipraeoptans sp.]